MKSSARLLATVKPERFLTPGNPTGLTGLLTHPAPRTQLLYYYSSTLQKLSKFPEHSVYRKSTEAITKQRYDIVAAIKPEGYEEWAQRAQKLVDKHPEVFGKDADVRNIFVPAQLTEYKNPLDTEWDGRNLSVCILIDLVTRELMRRQVATSQGDDVDWENEPPLEAEQIAEIENKIGAGLIEEVIEVAEGENKLVDTILESRCWEELEEKPPQGQWDYFTRDQHTPGTQEPPKDKN
ncbi:MAG: hypothetical protein Q9203_006093 [Teloschistes exilis]